MKLFGYDLAIKKKVTELGGMVIKDFGDGTWYKPNWFQLGGSAPDSSIAFKSTGVFTCVSILAQEIARLRITHYTDPDLNGQNEMYRSDTSRLLRKPNKYQTSSDFFLAMMHSLLMNGNSYSVATRDSRNRVTSLTPLNPLAVQPHIIPDTGEIFYRIAITDMDIMGFDPRDFIPQRDMLHVRLFTPTHPLIGVSPLTACGASVSLGLTIQAEQTRFFQNQSKPSGLLTTPKPLNKEQAKRLSEAWAKGTRGDNSGKVPVLDNDLKFQQMSLSSAEAQLIEQYGLTKKDIAIVYRVPLYMVGEGESQFKTAEASQRDFVTRSLGFYIEHIEAALDAFFGFDGRTEFIEFDVERGIMRPEYNARIEGLTKGVQGGIFSPNEARKNEGLPAKEAGDNLFMQRQNVPIDMLGDDVLAMESSGSSDTEETDDAEDPPEEQNNSYDNIKNLIAEKLGRLA